MLYQWFVGVCGTPRWKRPRLNALTSSPSVGSSIRASRSRRLGLRDKSEISASDHGFWTNLGVGLVGSLLGAFLAGMLGIHFWGWVGSLVISTLGVVAAVSYAVARRTALPIRRLTAALREAASGNFDFRLSHNRKDEFGELFEGFNRLAGAVQARLETAPIVQVGTTAAKRRAFRTRGFSTPTGEAEVRSLRGPPPGADPTLIAPAPSTGLERIFNARR